MPRHPTRPLVLILTLLAFILLPPALSATESPDATPGLVSQLWSLFSILFTDTGSALEPDGVNAGPRSGSGTEHNAGTGETGSGLDPNG
jgi:hypothetical protein